MKYYFGKISINFANCIPANVEIKKSIDIFNGFQNNTNSTLKIVLENPYINTEKKIKDSRKEIILGSNLSNMQNILLDNEFSNDIQNINKAIKLNFYIINNDTKENNKNILNIKEKILPMFYSCEVDDVFNKDNEIMISDIIEVDGCKLLYEIMRNKSYMIDFLFCDVLSENEKITFKEQQNYDNVQKINIADKKYTYEEFKSKYKCELKNQNLNEEIERIFNTNYIESKKTPQGINYYFEEYNESERKMQYEILTQALYSCNRIDKPYYYIINYRLCSDEKNNTWDLNFLSAANKLSTNQMFFIQIDEINVKRYDEVLFDLNFGNLLKLIGMYQYVNVFGIYLNTIWLPNNNWADSVLKNNISSLIYIRNKLNQSAQIEYAKKKLNSIGYSECTPSVINAIENMNLKLTGLTTKEIDNIIQDKLRICSELFYIDSYKNVLGSKIISSAYDKIMNLKGLKNLKEEIEKQFKTSKYKNFNEITNTKIDGLNKIFDSVRNSWLLYGEPGIGKSTVAVYIAKFLYQLGRVKKDNPIIYVPNKSRNDAFVFNENNQMQINDYFINACDGVLIIDEIECLSTLDKQLLLQLMEEYKDRVTVIFCGYEVEANKFLESNEGYKSRITHKIHLENYTLDELCEIFKEKVLEKSFEVTCDAMTKMRGKIEEAMHVKGFGQARFIETIVERLIEIHATNKMNYFEKCAEDNAKVDINSSDINVIDVMDIKLLNLADILGNEYLVMKKCGNPMNELKNLIGCKNVKNAVEEFVAKCIVDIEKIKKDLIDKSKLNMHMVFFGNPGTAKTSVARIIARILYDKGIVNSPVIKEVGASDLVGEYVGQTAIKTTELLRNAQGGVLFIDEAYALSNTNAGGFNKEAIDSLIKELENIRENTVVILAGYKKGMEELIRLNPGFKSRISRYIDFPNYTIDELMLIFDKIVKDEGYCLNKNEIAEIHDIIRKILEKKIDEEDFGNGRECRKIFEAAVNKQSLRLSINNKDISLLNKKVLMTLKLEDFDIKCDDFYEKQNILGFNIAA